MKRRKFLLQTGLATAGGIAVSSLGGCASGISAATPSASGGTNLVAIIADPTDPVVATPAAQWGIEQLRYALAKRGLEVKIAAKIEEVPAWADCIVATGGKSALARDAKVTPANVPEALAIARTKLGSREALVLSGADGRGLMYALTEIADAVPGSPRAAMRPADSIAEVPANKVRSVMRMFVSDVEDRGWYNDQNFWSNYLSLLASQRFNRFNLAFGLGYDAPSGLVDTYLYFAYPFLLSVPGYNVAATGLPTTERDQNLAMLRFISDEAAARGLDFQLGLWTHAYQWTNSPKANYNITGLTQQTQAPYSRDALAIILKECPNITGVTFRIHGESGVPEGSYDLWKTIFDGCVRSGRPVELDMHAKGMDQQTIDVALGTGLPVTISPKFWAEHMGLPYHQAAIRPTEVPTRARGGGAFAQSNGARSFLRYGYGDLLTSDRKYGIFHRIWPGTQRVLLWGDPVFAAGYSRAGSFGGSLGHEIFDPLSFKGRKGSGLPGGRDGYADTTMRDPVGDFDKYRYTFQLWGRLLYNPETDPAGWRRSLDRNFADGSGSVEVSLAHASRILPLVTTAHLPSGANNNYWPEMYVNMSIVDPTHPDPYTDTPSPKKFGAVSPLDPQLFSSIDDYANELLNGSDKARYSPVEVAQWLEDNAKTAEDYFGRAREKDPHRQDGVYRRYATDVQIQIGLGRFFGKKFRAGVLYALYERTNDQSTLLAALRLYRETRTAWAEIVRVSSDIYVKDMTYGDGWFQRGHWADRLDAIDQDIDAMEQKSSLAAASAESSAKVSQVLAGITGTPPARPVFNVSVAAPEFFRRGRPLGLELTSTPSNNALPLANVQLCYRHANQAETWRKSPVTGIGNNFKVEIPADYTDSPYMLTFYFELRNAAGQAAIYPGFNETLANQPYFVLNQAT